MKGNKRTLLCVVVPALGAALPSVLYACPSCFGAADAPMTQGMNMGILSLLGVTGSVLVGFGTVFLRLRRRMKAVAARSQSGNSEQRRITHG